MARDIISAIGISDYNPDRGGNIPLLSFKFAKPADISDADIDEILDLLGLRRKTTADTTPCPVTIGFKPRKLNFVRADGNSVSFVLVNKSQAINTAIAVRDFINAANPTNQVVCVELAGEKWDDLKLELAPGAGAPAPGTPSRVTTGGKQVQYSGKIPYQYDGATGSTTTISVKVDTDVLVAGVPGVPTVLSTIWDGCVGDFDAANPCPSSSDITPRYYKPTLFVGDGTTNYYQQSQVPVKSFDTPDILACGEAIAALTATVCLEYNGETNKRLHRLLP